MESLDNSSSSWPALNESTDGSMLFREDPSSTPYSSRMHDLWKEQRFCDVTLVVGDQQFPAHRLVLASHSLYFEALFKPSMVEGNQSTIQLYEIQPEYFESLLAFMYSGCLTITDENVEGLLLSANFLGLESACQACGSYLLHRLAPENAISLLELANAYDQHSLVAQISKYTAKHIATISEYSDFVEISVDLLESILQEQDDLATRGKYENFLSPWESEGMLVDILLKYIMHDPDRLSLIPRVFSYVCAGSLSEVTRMDLQNKILNMGSFRGLDYLLENPPSCTAPRKGADYCVVTGPEYGFMSRDLKKQCVMRDDKCPIRGMDFFTCTWFNSDERKDTQVLSGLKVHFGDGHADTIGNVDGLPRQSFHLRDGEKIVAAQVKASLLVDQLFFWTNTKQVYGPFIGTGGHRYQKEAPVRPDDDGYLGGLICQAVCHRDQWVLSNLTFKWLVSRHKRITGSCSISCDEDSDVIVCDDNDGSDWFGMHDDDLP